MIAMESSKKFVGFSRARSAVSALSRWMCGSTKDGVVRRPPASISCVARSVSRGSIRWMRPSAMPISTRSAWCRRRALLTIRSMGSGADLGIQQRVEQVHEEGDEDVDDRRDEGEGHEGGVVLVLDGGDGVEAEAGPREDRLRDDDAADELAELEADHGEDRDRRVPERVLEHHARLGNALGARSTQVILVQDV